MWNPLIVALVVAMATSGCVREAPAAGPGTRPAVGMQSHVLWESQSDEERLATLDAVAASGAGWVRIDLGWCSVEEAGPGQISGWYVGRADRMVDAARARGLQVLMTLWCTPGWANGGRSRSVPPSDVTHYANAARHLAGHFAGRVAAWEVWNEPNLRRFWSSKDPVAYTQLLKAAYPAFKAGDPNATVVFGGPSYNDAPWIDRAYRAGAKGSFDAMATHPYMGKSDAAPDHEEPGKIWTLVNVTAVREVMLRHGDERPIWFTEMGWSSHANKGNEEPWEVGVTEQQQADYSVAAIELVRARYSYVTHMFFYNDRTKSSGDVHEDGYGLLRRDLSPKPAYDAIKSYLATHPVEPRPPPPTASGPSNESPAPTVSEPQ